MLGFAMRIVMGRERRESGDLIEKCIFNRGCIVHPFVKTLVGNKDNLNGELIIKY